MGGGAERESVQKRTGAYMGGSKEREYACNLTVFRVFAVVVVFVLLCFFRFEVCRFYKYLE